jgi:hypothetical protein
MNRYIVLLAVELSLASLPGVFLRPQGGVNIAKENILPMSACGPMSAYMALRAIGKDCSLDDLMLKCGYRGEPVEVKKVYDALNSLEGIRCSIKTYSRAELMAQLKKNHCAAILLINIRSDAIDHLSTICLRNNKLLLLEYPFIQEINEHLITPEFWKGDCLLVQHKSRFISRTIYMYLAAILCSFILGMLSKCFLTKRRLINVLVLTIVAACDVSGIAYGETVCRISKRTPHIIDMGIIEDENTIEDVFIENDTRNTVTIKSVNVSCSSCLKPIRIPIEIAPGEKGLFRFKLINKRKGAVQSRVIVQTNKVGNVLISFKTIIPKIWSYPEVEFGSIERGQLVHQSVFVLSIGYPKVKIKDVTISSSITDPKTKIRDANDDPSLAPIKARMMGDTQPAGLTYNLRKPKKSEILGLPQYAHCIGVLDLSLDSSKLEIGSFISQLVLKTNVPQFSQLCIPLKGEVLGDVRVYPKKLLFLYRSGDTQISRQCQVILNKVNEFRMHEVIKIVVSYVVKPHYRLTAHPNMLVFGDVEPNSTSTLNLSIVSPYPEPLKIMSINCTHSEVKLSCLGKSQLSDIVQYSVAILPDKYIGTLDGSLAFETSAGKLEVPFCAYMKEPVEVIPRKVFFYPIRVGECTSVKVKAFSVNGKRFRIVKINSECNEITVENVRCDASTYELKIHFCPHRDMKGSGKTAFRVVTDTLGTRTIHCQYFVIP